MSLYVYYMSLCVCLICLYTSALCVESRRREGEAKTQLSALKDTYLKVLHA